MLELFGQLCDSCVGHLGSFEEQTIVFFLCGCELGLELGDPGLIGLGGLLGLLLGNLGSLKVSLDTKCTWDPQLTSRSCCRWCSKVCTSADLFCAVA